MTFKRKHLLAIVAVAILLLNGVLYITTPFSTIRQLEQRYHKAERGMTIQQVQNLMAHTPQEANGRWLPFWDDEPLPPSEAERIVTAIRYSVKTFYLPVSFEFTFDSDRRLVGRHIYD